MAKLITLDESGSFMTKKKEICFVGGFYKDHVNYIEEKKSAEEDLKVFCDEYSKRLHSLMVKYPQSLHGSDARPLFTESGESVDKGREPGGHNEYHQQVVKFKKAVKNHVIKYLADHGYRLYMYVMPGNSQDLNSTFSGSNILAIDNNSSNLYEQMAMIAVFNHIFFSITEDQDAYYLDLATRIFKADPKDVPPFYEMINKDKEGKGVFKSTTMGTYKTGISTMLYEHNADNKYEKANYYLNVESINYKGGGKSASSPFLYMTDIACSYLLGKIGEKFGWDNQKQSYTKKIDTQGFIEISQEQDVEIRIYDKTDAQFRQIIENIKKGNLAESFAIAYDLEHSSGKYRELYQKCWIEKAGNYLNRCLESLEFRNSFYAELPEQILFANEYMNVKEFSPNKGLYITEKLIDVIMDKTDYRERGRSLFRLYDLQLRGYNHRGSVDNVQKCIENAELYKHGIPIDEYCEHVLRILEYYFNSFQYNKVVSICKKIQKSADVIDNAYLKTAEISETIAREISPFAPETSGDVFQNTYRGKIYSTLGQAYSYLKKYEDADKAFYVALKSFDKDNINKDITFSYLLHMYIASENKIKYESIASGYFGRTELLDQCSMALRSRSPYAVFVFSKAFNKFYASNIDNWDCLKELIKWAVEGGTSSDNDRHPYELIYKQIYESFLQYKAYTWLSDFTETEKKAGTVKEMALNCIPDYEAEDTLRMIWLTTKISFLIKEGKHQDRIILSDIITRKEDWDILEKYHFPDISKESSVGSLMKKMDTMITYMYR